MRHAVMTRRGPLSGANRKTFAHVPPLTRSGWKRGIIPPLHGWPPTGGSHGKLHRTTKILSARRPRGRSRRAQQSRRPTRIAFFGPTLNSSPAIDQYEAFRTQLADLGFRDGQNVTIDYISVDNPRGPFVAVVDLMRSPPDLIVSAGPEVSLQGVVGATGFIPVVMIAINFDPLARGYIASLSR